MQYRYNIYSNSEFIVKKINRKYRRINNIYFYKVRIYKIRIRIEYISPLHVFQFNRNLS